MSDRETLRDPCAAPAGCPHGAHQAYYCATGCAHAAHPLTAPVYRPRIPVVEDYAAIRAGMRPDPVRTAEG